MTYPFGLAHALVGIVNKGRHDVICGVREAFRPKPDTDRFLNVGGINPDVLAVQARRFLFAGRRGTPTNLWDRLRSHAGILH